MSGREDDPDWSHRRTQELLDEANQAQAEARDARDRLHRSLQENRRLTELIGRAEELVQSMEGGIRALQGSVSLQLGYLMVQSSRSLRGLLSLPVRALRLMRNARRGHGKAHGRDPQVVQVPLPHDWFPPELRQELEQFHIDLAEGDHLRRKLSAPGGGRSIRFGHLPDDLSRVRMAAVMDEFTFNAFSECCEVTQLTAEGWLDEIDEIRPHLLFLESAWDGKDSSWQRQISGTSAELRQLVAHCRQHGIPVVFWSKEDPVHFKTFLATARLADVVFTTDIDCIKHYKNELGHDQVYLLPFATQPRSHSPMERYERKPGFCFAGSYYVRYPVRQRDFASLLDAVAELGSVDIYDRNHGKEHPNYKFPEEYRRYILGRLSYEQIDLAYKGYDFGININTVKHSQSMFARRVFDLLASNTTVVSNFSRGMRLMFGDLVISSDDRGQLVRALRPLTEDVTRRRKHRLLGLRKVMSEHTYQHRLGYVLGKAFAHAPGFALPRVSMVARVGSEEQLRRVLATFHRQVYEAKRLVLCFDDGFVPEVSPTSKHVHLLSGVQAASRTIASLVEASGYVGVLHPDDHYGANYLTDLVVATQYGERPVIGKQAHYRLMATGPELQGDGAQYRIAVGAARRRAIARADGFPDDRVSAWLDDRDGTIPGEFVAIDEFNYCEGAGAAEPLTAVDDEAGVDVGVAVATLLATAEGIGPDLPGDGTPQRDESAGLPGLEADQLSAGLDAIANKQLTASLDGKVLELHSTVPAGRHAYAYLDRSFTPQELQFTDIARMQLVCDNANGLNLVLVYLDASGEKISHALLKSGANLTITVPPATCSVQVGFRVTKPGIFRIRRLVFDHVPLPVDTLVTRSRHLLLAKNYPSYDDLYKHAFVHRRVLEYRRQGVEVDVFRIGSNGLSFYEFEGVDVACGQEDHLRAMLRSGEYETVLVHVMDRRMWEVVYEFIESVRVLVWAHGSEMQSASRRMFEYVAPAAKARAEALGEQRMRFWRSIFTERHPNLKMVFVSSWAASDVMEDVGVELPASAYAVVHNFIDCSLFSYTGKEAEQRKKILSIRPYASRVYANDLAVAAIIALSSRPFFNDLEFRLVGDGPLFEETVAPVRRFANVQIEQRFLPQAEIASLHREYGVFLVPSRMDSQGVSRDEAMASGLVPVTNRVAAIPEFVDPDCGFLAEAEDAPALADAIERLYHDPELFLRMSRNAAARVEQQCGFDATIARELELFGRDPRMDQPAKPAN